MRGGAGGASTTTNKKLTAALGALAQAVSALEEVPATQSEEAETVEQIIRKIGKTVNEWQNKMPTRNEMKTQLRKFHQLLEKDAHQMVNPKDAGLRSEAGNKRQQSFYTDFIRNIQTEEDRKNPNQWQTKGKGKGGKGKTKDKVGDEMKGLPKFDLGKILPSNAMISWQQLSRELEEAREPSGSAVIVDSIQRISEFQGLFKAHGLKRNVTMIAKATGEATSTITQPVNIWLPYMSNLHW